MMWLWLILAALAVFAVVLAARAAACRPSGEHYGPREDIQVDGEGAVQRLAQLVRIPPVSDYDEAKVDEAQFEKFREKLKELYPAVHEACPPVLCRGEGRTTGLLFRWKGASSAEPTVLMAHYDVVPVEEQRWAHPPFCGEVFDGELWGRGTLDTKITLLGVMEAAESLIRQGFVPKQDVYFAFGGDEEVSGHGAKDIIAYLKQQGVKPAFVVDEGGAVVDKVFPGVSAPCALIGIAEKGLCNVRFSVEGKGGHASAPPPHTAVGKLSRACAAVENHPFPARLSKPAKELFDTLGRHSTFVYRLIFANLGIFRGALDKICKKSGGELNALMRTTVAFTQMSGSKGMNVLPPYAEMVANLRIMCGESVESCVEYLRKTVADDDVKTEVVYGMDPSNISQTQGKAWEMMKRAVSQTWNDALVAPYLMLACSDSRHYGEISDHVYRFSAMALSKEERASIHGNDERIPVEKIVQTVHFYLRLISQF